MKDITRRTIVHYNYFLQVPAQLVQIFNIIAAMIYARLPEESRSEHVPPETWEECSGWEKGIKATLLRLSLLVEQISDGIGVFSERCGKQNTFIQLSHLLQKFIDVWTFQYIDLMNSAINLHRHNEISVWNRLKRDEIELTLSKRGWLADSL